MQIMINPGAEGRADATEANAAAVVDRLCNELSLDRRKFTRVPIRDSGGHYGFDFEADDGRVLEVDVPGDDPNEVTEGRPFYSRRLYVDGSSWLYGFALNAIQRWIDNDDG